MPNILQFPPVSLPGGNYQSVLCRGNTAFIAIQFPIWGGEHFYRGRLGQDLTTTDGYKAFELCALNVLAHVKEKIGFERINGLQHMDAYYVAGENWDEGPFAVDGASDCFVRILGEKGWHSRAILGVASLPRQFSAGIVCSFAL